ncbi:MAG: hypothetical protein Q8S84_06475 [bacterium]|nr:hypothetical protein [bacterium]
MFSLQYAVKFAIHIISCCDNRGAYSFSIYSASSAPTLKLIIVQALPNTASLILGLSHFLAQLHPICAMNW